MFLRCSASPIPEGPPRKDPEQRFRRLGNKDSGGCYIYREKNSWWKGLCSIPYTGLLSRLPMGSVLTCGVCNSGAEVPRIRVRDKQERINNLWGEILGKQLRASKVKQASLFLHPVLLNVREEK